MSDNTKLNRDGLNQVWLKAMTILKSLTGNVRTDKGTLQEQIDKLEENASSGVDLTQAEYDALPDSKETDGVDYYITDEDFVATDAKAVGYDNTASGLAAKTVQVAIDEVVGKVNEVSENYALKAQITNPNLLDNPWFTVNQRGVTEYATNSYGVDRWYVGTNDTRKFTICSNGIKIESTSPNNSNNTFYQSFLAKELGLGGKTVTISAMVAEASEGAYLDIGVRKGKNFGETKSDWTAIAGTVNISVKTGDIITKTFIIPEDCNDIMLFDAELSNKPQPIGTYVVIRAVKLEIGSISTLALDAAPNYQQELAKCQRYYQNNIYIRPLVTMAREGLEFFAHTQVPLRRATTYGLSISGFDLVRVNNTEIDLRDNYTASVDSVVENGILINLDTDVTIPANSVGYGMMIRVKISADL